MEQGYDVKEIGRLLDSIHLMAYDMKVGLKHTDVHSALHRHDYDTGDQAQANVVSALLKLIYFVFELNI